MGGLDPLAARQIRDGAGDAEDLVMAPGGEAQALVGCPEEILPLFVKAADLPQEIAVEPGVFHLGSCAAAGPLLFPGGLHPEADGLGTLSRLPPVQLLVIQGAERTGKRLDQPQRQGFMAATSMKRLG